MFFTFNDININTKSKIESEFTCVSYREIPLNWQTGNEYFTAVGFILQGNSQTSFSASPRHKPYFFEV